MPCMVCSWSCCQHRGQHASHAGYSLDWQAAWSAHVHGLVWLVCILGWVVWSGLCGLVCKLGTTVLRQAGRLADEIRLDFEILKILYRLNYLDFYFLYSSTMLLIVLEVYFSLLFSNKADFRVCFVARKIRSPLFFMSIPTIRY